MIGALIVGVLIFCIVYYLIVIRWGADELPEELDRYRGPHQ